MSTPFTIRRTRWDLYVDALAAGQRWWSEERPTQRAGTEAVAGLRRGLRRRRAGRAADGTAAAGSGCARRGELRAIDYDELEQLGKLHADGTLTDEEFAAAKAKILGS